MFFGPRARFQVPSLKNYVLVCFSLNSIEEKCSRFISCEQFHLMFPVLFRLEFKFNEQSFRVCRGQWDNSIIVPKKSVFFHFHC